MNKIKLTKVIVASIATLGILGTGALTLSQVYAQTPAPSGSTNTTTIPAAGNSPVQGGQHVGKNGVKEVLLTGDDAAKATAAALKAVPGGTVDRVETDAEGATYEAHMTKSDGTHVTVKFDSSFNVTGIEDGPNGPMGNKAQ